MKRIMWVIGLLALVGLGATFTCHTGLNRIYQIQQRAVDGVSVQSDAAKKDGVSDEKAGTKKK